VLPPPRSPWAVLGSFSGLSQGFPHPSTDHYMSSPRPGSSTPHPPPMQGQALIHLGPFTPAQSQAHELTPLWVVLGAPGSLILTPAVAQGRRRE
jgi:hypothetical protein